MNLPASCIAAAYLALDVCGGEQAQWVFALSGRTAQRKLKIDTGFGLNLEALAGRHVEDGWQLGKNPFAGQLKTLTRYGADTPAGQWHQGHLIILGNGPKRLSGWQVYRRMRPLVNALLRQLV